MIVEIGIFFLCVVLTETSLRKTHPESLRPSTVIRSCATMCVQLATKLGEIVAKVTNTYRYIKDVWQDAVVIVAELGGFLEVPMGFVQGYIAYYKSIKISWVLATNITMGLVGIVSFLVPYYPMIFFRESITLLLRLSVFARHHWLAMMLMLIVVVGCQMIRTSTDDRVE